MDVSANEWLIWLNKLSNFFYFFFQKGKLIFSSILFYFFFGHCVDWVVNEIAFQSFFIFESYASKLLVNRITITLLCDIIFLSFISSFLALLPSSEDNTSVIDKAVTENVSKQSEHVLDILIQSGILTIQNNKKSIDLFYIFDFGDYFNDKLRISALSFS